jgi:hypothetical protein
MAPPESQASKHLKINPATSQDGSARDSDDCEQADNTASIDQWLDDGGAVLSID